MPPLPIYKPSQLLAHPTRKQNNTTDYEPQLPQNYSNNYTYYSIFVTVMSHESVTKMNVTSTAAKAWFAALFLFRLI